MNETMRASLTEDMARARALAEEGRQAPLIGGVIYVVWGMMIALCLLLNWAIGTRVLALSNWAVPAIWFVGMGTAGLVSSAIGRRLALRSGAVGIGNSVSTKVWNASGAFLGLFSAILFLNLLVLSPHSKGSNIGFGFAIFQPVCFGVYAVAMAASAEAAKSDLLKTFSKIAFGAMVVTAALIGRSEQLLAGAASALVVLVLPGLILMRRESAS